MYFVSNIFQTTQDDPWKGPPDYAQGSSCPSHQEAVADNVHLGGRLILLFFFYLLKMYFFIVFMFIFIQILYYLLIVICYNKSF